MFGRIAVTACVAFGLATAALAEDTIEYIDEAGKKLTARGNIREETPREVVIQTGSDRVEIPIHRIRDIKYDGQPPELVTIRSKEKQGRYEEAIAEYTELGKGIDPKDRFLLAEVAFSVFRCLAEQGALDPKKADEAIAWEAKHGKSFQDSRQNLELHELMGKIRLAKGDYEGAGKDFAALREVDWPGYPEKAAKYEGVALLKQKKLAESLEKFDQVLDSPSDDPTTQAQKNAATVYKAQVLVDQQKAADAEKLLRAALPSIPDAEFSIKALGYNTLGDALRQSQSNEKLAMLDGYMWVKVLYDQDQEQLARSLFNLSGIFRSLGQPERAEEMANRLKTDFPESEWTKKLAAK